MDTAFGRVGDEKIAKLSFRDLRRVKNEDNTEAVGARSLIKTLREGGGFTGDLVMRTYKTGVIFMPAMLSYLKRFQTLAIVTRSTRFIVLENGMKGGTFYQLNRKGRKLADQMARLPEKRSAPKNPEITVFAGVVAKPRSEANGADWD